ncbi:unnamed protein product [Heterobilharzia americana]|nr:unnamed protein product [Heterobilharzia americana]
MKQIVFLSFKVIQFQKINIETIKCTRFTEFRTYFKTVRHCIILSYEKLLYVNLLRYAFYFHRLNNFQCSYCNS